jgi:hypothetical protein
MLKSTRSRAVAYSFLAPAFLAGCGSAPPHATVATNTVISAPGKPPCAFNLDTPVNRIAADPNGKAVLERDVPGLMASKEYPLFDDMSLSQIAIMSGGRLSKDKLSLVQSDLQVSDLTP